ncbi:MAG: GNAT family N-acetyltransferase [Candidatus Obscuribacterales bacterium]|nr:GNAT family N-acetyltransferase [Candidatus Obscuribacterales bacterium]
MRIETHLVTDLPADIKQELSDRVATEFGDVPIVREHVWAEPTWAFLGLIDDHLVTFLNIVDRNARADDAPVRLFGLNNVITDPQHRRKGYSKQLNQSAIGFMTEKDPNAFGFLFCADDLIPFYTRLGWRKYQGEVTVSQPSGDKLWPSNAMLYDPANTVSWKTVHLCGLPW